jgi:hypothetical protein
MPTTLKPIRWGILATGNVANSMAQALSQTPDAQIVAVASRHQETADRFGDRWGIGRRHASCERLAGDPEVMVASQRGWGNFHRDYPLWDRPRLRATAIDRLNDGHLQVETLITQRIPFAKAAQAYELVDQGAADALKIVLTY